MKGTAARLIAKKPITGPDSLLRALRIYQSSPKFVGMSQRHLCLLSGGAGSRLWPISREEQPKQYFDLAQRGFPLLVETVKRLKAAGNLSILTNASLIYSSRGLLQRFQENVEILGEPHRRNTAAAVAFFTWRVLQKDPTGLVGIFPSDHLIEKPEAFRQALDMAFQQAEDGNVVTLGIHPTEASDAYGYIELEKKVDTKDLPIALRGLRFVEKPSRSRATEFVASGRFVWNAGIFVFKASVMAELFQKHQPEMWKSISSIRADLSNWDEVFKNLPSESIDYAVMEKLQKLTVVACDVGWSDIGSWEEVARRGTADKNQIDVQAHDNSYQNFTLAPKEVAFVGVSNLHVVETQDALLILRKGDGQKVRDVTEKLRLSKPALLKAHTFEERPWGRFEVLHDTPYYKSKRILVWAGQKLSYQSHAKRAEHWVIVKGEAQVTLNDKLIDLKMGEHVHIPLGAKHRIANPGKETMEFIEVQTGTYFGEDDIVRYSDDYGRMK